MGNIQSIHRKRRRRPKSVVPGDIQNHASGLRRAFTRHQKRGSEQEQRPDDTSSSTPKPVAVDPNVYIKGRRYQNITPKYYMPNDEQEQDRLTNLHFVLRHCFNGNYSAPVGDILKQRPASNNLLLQPSTSSSEDRFTSNTQPRVLDIACGTGIWMLEMASEFPQAQFFGIDLSVMYPTTIHPPNTHFSQGNVLEGLPFADGYFDYVHLAYVYNCFSKKDRQFLLTEVRRVLKPGGYLECRDVDPIIRKAGPRGHELLKPFIDKMDRHCDVDVTWTSQMASSLQDIAGLTDIHQQTISLNFVSSSPVSDIFNAAFQAEVENYRRFYTEAYPMTDEQFTEAKLALFEECARNRAYLNYTMCWGRKQVFDVVANTTSDGQQHLFSSSSSSGGPPAVLPERSRRKTDEIISAHEEERRKKEKTTDIYQFAHGYTE